MNDLEMVINRLQYLHDRETWEEGPLIYDDKSEERREITADALALLKEQKLRVMTIAPIIVNGEYECGECRYELRPDADTYCPCCGRKVKWDEAD